MDTKSFLGSVLSDEGYYCLFAANATEDHRQQKFYTSIDTLQDAAIKYDEDGYDVYFALATFTQNNSRKQDNVNSLRSFFLDLDCGPSKDYADQKTAIADVRKFCTALSLPTPAMVNSGRGVHVYWPLTEAVPRRQWTRVAETLKQRCAEHKLRADAGVTADSSRVLRFPDTHNYKQDPPLEVKSYGVDLPKATPFAEFASLLHGKPVEISEAPEEAAGVEAPVALFDKLASNKQWSFKDILTKTADGRGCEQIRRYLEDRNSASEPLWRGILATLKNCGDGSLKIAHSISRGYEGYTEEETTNKWHALEADRAYRCSTFDEATPDVCVNCIHQGKIRKPLDLGERVAEAEEEEEIEAPDPQGKTLTIPTYPKPYFRGRNGGVYIRSTVDGEVNEECLYHHDLYVTRLLHDASLGGYVVVFNLHLPHDGVREFTIPMASITSKEEFRKAVATNGVTAWGGTLEKLMRYTTRWIDELQMANAADEAHLQFGWTNKDMKEFVLGDTLVRGTDVDYNPPSKKTAGLFPAFVPEGTQEEFLDCLKFYNRPRFELHQFVIGTGFGSILMPLTGQNCMGLHLFGGSGVGKTTAMRAALGIFGNPEELMNHHKDTTNSRMNRAEVMKNVPLSSDEMTNITPDFASSYVYELSGGRQKNRMSSNGNTERFRGDPWQLIAVSSANSSIWQILSRDKEFPEAEMLRMLEISVDKSLKDPSLKAETDALFERITKNYGWIAIRYIQYIISHRRQVEEWLTELRRNLDKSAGLAQEHRFWSAGCAASLTGLYIAKKLGFIDWDLKQVRKWLVALLISRKNHLQDATASVHETLNNYVFENHASILQIRGSYDMRSANNNGLDELVIPEASPRGEWVGRYETDTKKLYLLPKPLKKWCTNQQVLYEHFIRDLQDEMGAKRVSIRLGKGTHLNLPAARTISVDFHDMKDDDSAESS
tara:strand:+ start:3604 stop:6429 length:2826 start_codon:yes stop_codon:yes gene_type:complete